MPTIRIQHVNSCSSEDSNHPAENLLELETYKKWRCASPGEKQAVVVLQFEKATVIHSIDIVDGDEEMDTDEEIRRIEGKDAEDPYDCSTDEAEFDEPQKCSVEEAKETSLNYSLPDFFSKCHFFLYGSFLPPDRRLLVRYIAAYNGHIEDYMGDKVSHVVTTNTWDNSFDEALSENSSLVFVRPKWIFACHQKKAIVPCQPYMIAPAH